MNSIHCVGAYGWEKRDRCISRVKWRRNVGARCLIHKIIYFYSLTTVYL